MANALPFLGELEIRVLRLVWQEQSCAEPEISGEIMTILVATSRRSRRDSRLAVSCLVIAVALTCAFPTLRGSSALGQRNQRGADIAGAGQGDSTLPMIETTVAESDDAPSENETHGVPTFRLYDGFDRKLALNWEPVRPDPTHVSLTKNPGRLTITTQTGGIYRDSGPSANNLYLIRNPVAEGGDFVLTTCLESFNPTTPYQQAGLLVYDDDDNYLKCGMESNKPSVQFRFIRETDGETINELDRSDVAENRVWIRVTKRGKSYERAYSTDGKAFFSAGQRTWGDGAPKWVGILAKNGETSKPAEIDAAFDFFEVRSLSDAEKNDPHNVERQKLQGAWKVVSCELSGKSLKRASFSHFVFEDARVTIKERTESHETEYTLDLTKEPKGIVLSAISSQARKPTNGIYSLEGETLVICLALQRNAAAPTELETKAGDSRLLVRLQRSSEKEDVDTETGREQVE